MGLTQTPVRVIHGPSSPPTDNALVVWDGTTGQRVKNSLATIDAFGRITLGADPTSALEAVTKQYLESALEGNFDLQGGYDASPNLFPTAANTNPLVANVLKAMVWYVTIAGTLGGTPVSPGDSVVALIDNPGQIAANWTIQQNALGYTPLSTANNGLLVSGTTAKLGGPLTQNTSITSGGFTLSLAGTTLTLEGSTTLILSAGGSVGTANQALVSNGTSSSWQTLSTTNITQGTNLYFTNAAAIASTLTGYVSGAGVISAADSILTAIQKLNGNIAALPAATVTTANNGLNVVGTTVKLGGALTQATTVGVGTFDLVFTTATGNWTTTGDLNLDPTGTLYARNYRFDIYDNITIADIINDGFSNWNFILDESGSTFNTSDYNIAINTTGNPNIFTGAAGNILVGNTILIANSITDSIIFAQDLQGDGIAKSYINGFLTTTYGANSSIFSHGDGNNFTDNYSCFAFGTSNYFDNLAGYGYAIGSGMVVSNQSVGFGVSYTTQSGGVNIGNIGITTAYFSYDGAFSYVGYDGGAGNSAFSVGSNNPAAMFNVGLNNEFRVDFVGNITEWGGQIYSSNSIFMTNPGIATITIGGGTSTGAITIGNSIGAQTVNINTIDTGIKTTNIGTGAIANLITIGSVTGTSSIDLKVGIGNFTLTGADASTYTIGTATTTGIITLGLSTATNTIRIGNANTATGATQTINIGAGTPTGTGKAVITIGNSNDASAVTIRAGTGLITIGGSASTGSILLGSSSASQVVSIANGSGGGTFQVFNNSATGQINLGNGFTNGSVTIGGTGVNIGAINIGIGTGAQTISLGTGGTGVKTIAIGGTAANVIAIGNTQSAGSISLGAAMTSGTISIGGTGAHVGTMTFGNSTGAQIVNIGIGTGALTINMGTGATNAKTINIGTAALANVINLGGTGALIGHFGVTAIARPTTAITASAFVTNTSGIINDTATWDGYTNGQVVKALRNIGILT